MTKKEEATRKGLVVQPEDGREYELGAMRAKFFVDGDQADGRYSISEWTLDPHADGPGAHSHDEDHIYCVLEGTVSLTIDGVRSEARSGAYAVIPGGVVHDFENQGARKCRFISINVPAGFEKMMPALVQWFAKQP